MDINFDRINNELSQIVGEFETLLNNGKYDEARDAVNDIVYELSANSDIELSMGGNTPDNRFHELYTALAQKIQDRETTHVAPAAGNTTDYGALKMLLSNVSAQIFNTAEVRKELIQKDPDLDEYKKALEDGIVESQQRKTQLQKEKVKYDRIEKELFFDNSGADRRITIEKEKVNVKQLQEVMDVIDSINANIAAKVAATDPAVQANLQTQIDTQKNGLKAKLNQLQSQGLDITSLGSIDDFVEDANLASSKTKTETLRDSRLAILIAEYDAVKQKIDDAKKGHIVIKDADGNDVDISNEEIIRLAPDMSTIDLTTETGRDQLEKLIQDITAISKRISNEIIVCNQEVEIFTDHIKVMEFEKDQLAKDPNDRQAYIDAFDTTTKTKIDDEKTRRHDDAQAKFSGDRKKAKEYKEAWNRFKAHRRTQTITEMVNGQSYTYEYEYLEDYPEKDDDLEFMQLESWENKNKKTALINKMIEGEDNPEEQLKLITSVYEDESLKQIEELINSYNNGSYTAYTGNAVTPDMMEAAQKDLEAARARIAMQFKRDEDYVKNYNSSHFDAKDTVALALTGGSAMRARTNQSKKNLTFKDALGAFLKWTPYDVKADGKIHPIRTTLANIGGIVSIPFRTLEVAIGAGVAGVTTVVSKISGTYGMPTPYNVGYIHRKEARQEYYLSHGSSRFGAWFKSFFNMKVKDENGNLIKINDKLVQDRCKLIDESIEDKYIRGARVKLMEDQIAAKKNQEARKIAYKNKAKSAELYEDIYENNPDLIKANPAEKKKIVDRAMQRAILGMGGKTARPITDQSKSYVTNGRKRTGRFVQNNPDQMHDPIDMNIRNGYDFSDTVGDTIWTNAVSRENIQRGNTKAMDFALRIAACATMPFFKGILSKWTIQTKLKKPDIVEQDTIIPGKHVDGHVEYIQGEKTIIQHRPKIGDIQREVTYTKDVPISYDNATFGDLQRGGDAYWCARLGQYKGPHPSVHFSSDATQIQGFNVSFTDPLNGKHVEWSTSIPQIKQYINEHPGLNEFSETYQDLSGITEGASLSTLTDYMPSEVKDAFLRYMESNSNNLQAFNEATQFAWGIPRGSAATMAQGWSASDVAMDLMKKVTGTKTITTRGIVGWEDIPAKIPYTFKKVIEGYDIPPQVVPGKVISGGNYSFDIPQVYAIGAMSGLGEVLTQGLSPRYRRAQKSTINYHGKDRNGRATINNDQGRSDMYKSPTLTDGDPRTYQRYEHHHSRKDRALNSMDSQGRPIKKADGHTDQKVWDDDDFVL